MRECPSCGRSNPETARYCATCGADFAVSAGVSRPEEPAPHIDSEVVGPFPGAAPPSVAYRHLSLELLAWALWLLAIASLPVFWLALDAAFADNRWDRSDEWVLFGALIFAVTSGSVVFLATSFATNLLSRPPMQVLAGSSVWFLFVPILLVWVVSIAVAALNRSESSQRFLGVMSRLVLGGMLVVVFGALSLALFGLPLVLPWLAVMIWAPIQLARAARQPQPPPLGPTVWRGSPSV